MTDVKVKICGIRRIESAVHAVESGADFLGFNFVLSSHRFISPVKARDIINHVRKKVTVVGVFHNMPAHQVNELIHFLQLPIVQLHGHEDALYIQQIKANVLKAVTLPQDFLVDQTIEALHSYNAHHVLLDREVQGQGEMVNLQKAKSIVSTFSTFIAGGLHPENVSQVVQEVSPFAVDVAGGIETHGQEDVHKIHQFIQNAKGIGK